MKKVVVSVLFGASLLCSAAPEIRIEAESLKGTSKISSQDSFSGGKVAGQWQELTGTVEIPEDGTWSVWVRCNTLWKYFTRYYPPAVAKSIRHLAIEIDGKRLEFGTETEANQTWIEQRVVLSKGTHKFSLKKIGINPNADVIVFTKDPKYKPTPSQHMIGKRNLPDPIVRFKAQKAASDIRIEGEALEGTFKSASYYYFSGGKNAEKWQQLDGTVEIPEDGSWSVWIRCNATWKYFIRYYGQAKAMNMRHFAMDINGKTLKFGTDFDSHSAWIEQKIDLPKGTHKFSLKKIGIDPRVDVIIFTRNPKYDPMPNWHTVGKQTVPDTIVRHVTAAESSKKKIFDVPRIAAPKIDGKLDDPAWKGAMTGELVVSGSGKIPVERTRYWIGGDDKNIYIAFRCYESNVKGIKTTFTHEDNRDSNIFADDCVEIFIDPFNDGVSGKYQFIINSRGVFFDAYCGNKNYQSKLRRSCSITADSWNAEIAIPFEDIGMSPRGAETFMLNLTRTRHALPREYSCLLAGERGTGFSHLSHFLFFKPVKGDCPVTFLSFGSEASPYVYFKNTDSNDKNQYAVTLSAFDSKGVKIKDFTGVSSLEKQGVINWKITRNKVARIDYAVYKTTSGKEKIYSNSFFFPQLAPPKQTRTIKDPLCESLFSKEYRKQLICNGYTWTFENLALGNDHAFLRQYAIAFDLDNYVKGVLDTGTFSLFTPRSFEWWDKNFPGKQKDIPVILMPLVNRQSVPAGLHPRLTIVPEVKKLYLQNVRELAARPEVKAFTVGDEIVHFNEKYLIEAMHNTEKVHPSVIAIDARIKKEFGQGKYGIPKADEKNPFALIAYRRFLNHEVNNLFREAAAVARKVNPDIKVMSDDPLGSVSWIYDFTEWKDIFDIVTHQLDPQTENMDPMGFLTRYLADLSGVEHVWPCPHVEEYSKNFTPSEVLDELSSAIRNGATGFHFFLNQTIGKRAKKKYLVSEYWGAPDRFATMMNVLKFLRTTPKLKEFKRDAAVFVATDTLRSYVKAVLPERDTFLHGFIGNGAGVNYSVINENKLAGLEQFKIIFSSQCKYTPEDALKKLQKYVAQGGTLVILDPEAFSFSPEGKSLDQERIDFLGISAITGNGTAENIEYAGQTLSFQGMGYAKLKLAPGAEAVSKFANGDAAIIRKKYGKGQVLTFSAIPCSANLAGNKSWEKAFENICSAAGCEVNSPIWRFRLPEKLVAELPKVKGVCLTDNSVLWRCFKMDQSNNGEIGGYYTISPKPSWVPDNGTEKIPFNKGKLTDRPRAVMGPSASLMASHWNKWAVAYNPGKDPITIDFCFNRKQAIKKAVLWCYGDVRNYEFSVEGQKCSVTSKSKPTMMMEQIELVLPQAVTADKGQIKISGGDKRLVIAEIEVWAE